MRNYLSKSLPRAGIELAHESPEGRELTPTPKYRWRKHWPRTEITLRLARPRRIDRLSIIYSQKWTAGWTGKVSPRRPDLVTEKLILNKNDPKRTLTAASNWPSKLFRRNLKRSRTASSADLATLERPFWHCLMTSDVISPPRPPMTSLWCIASLRADSIADIVSSQWGFLRFWNNYVLITSWWRHYRLVIIKNVPYSRGSNVLEQYLILFWDFEADPILFLIGQIVVVQISLATPADVKVLSFVDCDLGDSLVD